MDGSRTTRLGLPLLHAGQAQKEMFHNMAIADIDVLLHAAVERVEESPPEEDPAPGTCFLIGSVSMGAWDGHTGEIACWNAGGWRFVRPIEGMRCWSIADGLWLQWRNGEWERGVISAKHVLIDEVKVVGERQAGVPLPAGGGTIDSEARTAISALIQRLEAHGLIATESP